MSDPSITHILVSLPGMKFVRGGELWGRDYFGSCKDKGCSDAPLPLSLVGVEQMAHTMHLCARTKEGIYCRGTNRWGESGDEPTNEYVEQFVKIPVGPSIDVACGSGHSCAVSKENRLFCWGDNSRGQTGEGPRQSHRPVLVDDKVRRVAAGDYTTCYLLLDGTAHCLGMRSPWELSEEKGGPRIINHERMIAHENLVEIAAGPHHYCALSFEGHAYCWGDNRNGQVWPNASDFVGTPTLIPLSGKVLSLALGDVHSCALLASREVHCWGSSRFGSMDSYDDRPTLSRRMFQ